MTESRVSVLRVLLRESLYVVDDLAVADAMILRARLRRTVAEPSFRSDDRGPRIRSFRRDRDARSFRLTSGPGLRRAHH